MFSKHVLVGVLSYGYDVDFEHSRRARGGWGWTAEVWW